MPFYIFDYTYILVIIAFIITLLAQIRVKSAYSKYSSIKNRHGITGADAAAMILYRGSNESSTRVRIEGVRGELTDHYDPSANVIRLSDGVIDRSSVAAVGIAAHEAGHALQHSEGYFPIKIRSSIIPVCNFASRLAWPLFFIGLMISSASEASSTVGTLFMNFGIIAFSVAVLFQLVTLPVEFNASRRAFTLLKADGRLSDDELYGVKKVLTAAALTYVAALASSLIQLIRLVLISSSRSRRD